MRIVIEGTPEEVADAIRRLAPPQDIKPVFVPKREPKFTIETGPVWIDPNIDWSRYFAPTGATEVTLPKSMCGTAVKEI